MLLMCSSPVVCIIPSFMGPHSSQEDFENRRQWNSYITTNKIDVSQGPVSKYTSSFF